MAAGIVQGIDMGAVGYVMELGQTWHMFPEYEHIEGPVSIETARAKLEFPVEKIALRPALTPSQTIMLLDAGMDEETAHALNADPVGTMYALMRMDSGAILHTESVSGDYELVLNSQFLDMINDMLTFECNSRFHIESCGTLFGGREAFVNILLDDIQIAGDSSKTAFRLMFANSYGNNAIFAGMHWKRIVCNNTLTIAKAQAAATATLRKFIHTSGAPGRVKNHLIDLTTLFDVIKEHRESLDHMASTPMTVADVEKFLSGLFPVKEHAGLRMISVKTNMRDRVRHLFEEREDLQGGIGRTRFAMLQAVTFHTSHDMSGKRGTDYAYAWHKSLTDHADHRNQLNQRAFLLLESPDLILA